MKLTSLLPSAAAVALVTAAVLAATTGVQATQDQPSSQSAPNSPAPGSPPAGMAPGGPPMHNFPPPTNLQVLPKDLTGEQVRKIMGTWAGSLGVHCDFCHQPDPNKIGPNGQPRLNFADDTKDDKKIARIMYKMTQDINATYISKTKEIDTDAMNMTVTCGTCHRGHEMPEEFVIPKEGPPPATAAPAGGAAQPASN